MTLEATHRSGAGPVHRGRTTVGSPALSGARYRTGRLLGRGGTAEVFAAVDTRSGRQVAVKRLHEHLAGDPVQRDRFRREASSAAQVEHPGVVAVLGTDQVPASTGATWVPIIAMELMEGGSLRDAQRRSRATVGRSLEIAADILDALGASHSAGIVHRDIKPGNVLFTSDGRVKVADFGTACSVSETVESEAESSTVTGTVHYMAPEQARGLPADQRSDLYAVGCLLYELVVGRPPFTGDSAISVSYQQVTRCPERPSPLDPGLPSVMDSVLERALEKDPDHRYQTAAEMRADIVAARRELGGVSSLGRRGVSLPQAEMPRVGHPDALLGWRADSLGPLA